MTKSISYSKIAQLLNDRFGDDKSIVYVVKNFYEPKKLEPIADCYEVKFYSPIKGSSALHYFGHLLLRDDYSFAHILGGTIKNDDDRSPENAIKLLANWVKEFRENPHNPTLWDMNHFDLGDISPQAISTLHDELL
jgi:hypothetical protein